MGVKIIPSVTGSVKGSNKAIQGQVNNPVPPVRLTYVGGETATAIVEINQERRVIYVKTKAVGNIHVVSTRADLYNYDVTTLQINDVVEVLYDEEYNDAQTYNKYTGEEDPALRWEFLEKVGPYYTEDEIDEMDQDLRDAIQELAETLQTAIETEATNREQADTALGALISAEESRAEGAEANLASDIQAEETRARGAESALGTRIDNETSAREAGDQHLQQQIDSIEARTDVVDIVACYNYDNVSPKPESDLVHYDKSKLSNNDVIKVLNDETKQGAITHYRLVNNAWSFIGAIGPYYTKSESDSFNNALNDKIDAEIARAAARENEIEDELNTAQTYVSIESFVEDFNTWEKDPKVVGKNIYITSDNTPVLWIVKVENDSVEYQYTTDEEFIEALTTNKATTVQVGYYRFFKLSDGSGGGGGGTDINYEENTSSGSLNITIQKNHVITCTSKAITKMNLIIPEVSYPFYSELSFRSNQPWDTSDPNYFKVTNQTGKEVVFVQFGRPVDYKPAAQSSRNSVIDLLFYYDALDNITCFINEYPTKID